MELHGHAAEPVILACVSPAQLGRFRDKLAESNPDMRYAAIGQLAVALAKDAFPSLTVSSHAWTYNASEDCYSRA
jgi:hypothetical protein